MAVVVRGLRFAHPRLSPFGLRLRGHVLDGRPFFFELSKAFGIFVAIHLVFLWRFVRYFCGDSFGILVVIRSVFLWRFIRYFCGKSFGIFVVVAMAY